jgi:hypothetical protein
MFIERWLKKRFERQDEQDAERKAHKRLKEADALAARLNAEAEAQCKKKEGELVEVVRLALRKEARARTGLDVGGMSEELDSPPPSFKDPLGSL